MLTALFLSKVVLAIVANVTEAAHAIVPTVWSDDGSLAVDNNESFTLLKGFGLKLGPGQDAAKVRGGRTSVPVQQSTVEGIQHHNTDTGV